MEKDLHYGTSLKLENETLINIEEILMEIRSGIDKLELKVVEKDEKLMKSQFYILEIKDKIQYFNEFFKDPEGFSSQRSTLEHLIDNQKSKNLQILSENLQLSLRISEIEQTISNNNKILLSCTQNKNYPDLNQISQEIQAKVVENKNLANQERKQTEKIQESIKTLSKDIKTIKEKIKNLAEIKENLIKKSEKCEENIQIVEEKIKSHQSEEQNLAEKLFIAKREAEEALLSFQKFKFRLASVFRQEYTIVITKSNTGLLILLHSNKQEIKITKEIHCSVFINKKRPNRFYLTTGKETREFESEEAAKIVKFLNLAIQLNSEESTAV